MKDVHFVSLGCARNLVDSEVMAGMLAEQGYRLSDDPSEAELIIVNTCGFIDTAKEESVGSILEAARYKQAQRGRCKYLVVAGCLSERYPEELKQSIPEIDLITGSSAFNSIVEKVDSLKAKDQDDETSVIIDKQRLSDFDLPRVNSQAFYTAYLKLAEGCAKRCSFCVIPRLRGKLRSRSVSSLLSEAKRLAENGVRELNLIAQDLTDFGKDRGKENDLVELLDGLVEIEGIHWIRLFYVYPDQFSPELLDCMARHSKICNYLDLPIQHIHDDILKRMNRHTSEKQVRNMIDNLRGKLPDMVIRSSLMVGFPGERKEHFARLEAFVAEGLIDQLGVFTYSHEEGAPSFQLPDDVPTEVKEERRECLHNSQLKQQQIALRKWMGKELEVLVEGPHPDTDLLLASRHFGQAPGIDNMTMINDGHAEVGHFTRVRVNEIVGLDLCAEVI